ncbi:ATP-binding protein [Microbacterium sp. M28]|uniref:ATP-binding protein n=1 Tax=Microbacterium sp. M28 TaxID=2962064 RepID=UPI0021F45994|nr:ATP-binding protein [Microbacterium sp. M28]UYO96050.1 ATP-binding protein [Microbacterium sp. M28]
MKIADITHEYVNEPGSATPLPAEFSSPLPRDRYASIGQTEEYYERMRSLLGAERMQEALHALGDLAEDPTRLDFFREHDVVSSSLMREVSAATIKNKFRRMVLSGGGNAAYDFVYARPSQSPLPVPDTTLEFEVVPGSTPPSNVHALIGRNGSGKTTILRSMARALLGGGIVTPKDGSFRSRDGGSLDIANLVYVSFSAFDEAELPVLDKQLQWSVPYSYVGLQYIPGHEPDPPGPELPEPLTMEKATRPPSALGTDFAASAKNVIAKGWRESWLTALRTLESDPNFHEAEVSQLASESADEDRIVADALALWQTLSTGHKIVLLTITRLVETVVERTLVLADEPEGHLHPPLLAALIRAISDLLQERNGVAIVATHSPVVLQEVPRKCAYKLLRVGRSQSAERPTIETFGESVGMLSSEVFSLELSDSGFHRMLTAAALQLGSYEAVVDHFHGELGFEARALLRSWFAAQRV